MNSPEQLNGYLLRLQSRLRALWTARGAALATGAALVATILAVLVANAFAFSAASLIGSRIVLFLAVAAALALGLRPLLGLNRRAAARRAEREYPAFEQRLLTFAEAAPDAREPFLDLLARDTIEVARLAAPEEIVPARRVLQFGGAALGALLALLFLITAGPGFLGYGSRVLWAGTPRDGAAPFYDLVIAPGNRTLRRGADQLVTARPVGFAPLGVRLFARYRTASRWEEVTMQPQPGSSEFGFLFAALPETVEYYAGSGRIRSKTYTLNVRDLPLVKRIRVSYRYPSWTGLPVATEDPGGDLRAVEGTEAEISVLTDRPLENGALVLDDSTQVALTPGAGNVSTGRVTLRKDGLYHVAALDRGEAVRLTEDYFIEARKDSPPVVRIARPGRDAKASPIEEVPVSVEASDDFGLQGLELHYSVNGAPEKVAPLLKQKNARQADGSATLCLEDFKLVPGDIVSLYATARNAHLTSRTDIFFVQAQPFEREYSQSQQMGGGGGGGDGDRQNEISERQKEIIAATWNELRRSAPGTANAAFLSDVQAKLRDQVKSLGGRMQRRELSAQNQEFQSFSREMEQAAEDMAAASGKLKASQWQQALEPEQKALQHLLRAESTFRQIQVAFGNRGGGGGGGRAGAGRDLENLFDLELDTEKNQYETGRQQGSAEQQARGIDEALQKLEQLARRQQELAAQQRNQQQSFQQRWQQEMLRREAEELRRQMEQLSRNSAGQPSSQQGSQQGSQGSQQSGGNQSVEQAMRRLEEAARDMRQASSGGQAESRRAAQRLQEARELLGGMRREQSSQQLDDMVRRSEALAGQQEKFADRLSQAGGSQPQQLGQPMPGLAPSLRRQMDPRQAQEMASEKDRMGAELQRLERDMQNAARDLASTERSASAKVRDALANSQQNELGLRMKYNADMIRRGFGEMVAMREAPVTQGLQNLRDQLRDARSALGGGQPGRAAEGQAERERALAQVEQLRNRMEQGGNQGGGGLRGALEGTPGAGAPGEGTERVWRDSLRDLSRIRQMLRGNPELEDYVETMIRDLDRLDPKLAPGNPLLAGRIQAQMLPAIERLEIELRRGLEGGRSGEIRTGAPDRVPPDYADAVAEYFRRLSKAR